MNSRRRVNSAVGLLRLHMKVSLTTVVLIACLNNAVSLQGQTPNCRSAAVDAHIKDVIAKLPPDSSMRRALEKGDRGDCIHQPWMDRMKQYGIKQAGFLIGFSRGRQGFTFKVLAATYSTDYADDAAAIIHDRKLLKRIRDEGIEQELRDAVLQKAKQFFSLTWRAGQGEHGKWGESLVDDETLPTLGYIT